jgi:hypothetical protein
MTTLAKLTGVKPTGLTVYHCGTMCAPAKRTLCPHCQVGYAEVGKKCPYCERRIEGKIP